MALKFNPHTDELDYYKSVEELVSATVSDETTWGIASNAGSDDTLSKGDHTHGSPGFGRTVMVSLM